MKKLIVIVGVVLAAYIVGHVLTKSLLAKEAEAIFERENLPVEVEALALDTPFFAEAVRGTMLVKHRNDTFAVEFKTVGNPLYSGKSYYLEIAGEDMAKLRVGSLFNQLLGR